MRPTQQPIRISMGDGPPLVLPVSPAIGEFIQSCGNPRAARTSPAAAPPADNAATPAGNSAQ